MTFQPAAAVFYDAARALLRSGGSPRVVAYLLRCAVATEKATRSLSVNHELPVEAAAVRQLTYRAYWIAAGEPGIAAGCLDSAIEWALGPHVGSPEGQYLGTLRVHRLVHD